MYCKIPSPLGELLLAASESGLQGIWFTDGRYAPQPERLEGREEDAVFAPVVAWLRGYLAGEAPEPDGIALDLHGSSFQMLVWEELKKIPYGEVMTYGAIAKALEQKLGHRVAAQAVGGAVGRNPISLFIPCHRVVGAGGKLTGYGGGLWRKEYLLSLEQKKA